MLRSIISFSVDKQIPVYLPFQDLNEDPAFEAPRNWCRIKRAADLGNFVHHGKAFKLKKLKPKPYAVLPAIQVRDVSTVVDEAVILAYVENHKWAIAIVRAWHGKTSKRRHEASRRRAQARIAENGAG